MKKKERDVILSIKQGIFTAMTGVIIASNVVTPVYAAGETVPDPDPEENKDNSTVDGADVSKADVEYKDGEGNTITESEYEAASSTSDLGEMTGYESKKNDQGGDTTTTTYQKTDENGNVVSDTTVVVETTHSEEETGEYHGQKEEGDVVDGPEVIAVLVDSKGNPVLKNGEKQYKKVTSYHYNKETGYYETQIDTDTETITTTTKIYTGEYKEITAEEALTKGYDKVEYYKSNDNGEKVLLTDIVGEDGNVVKTAAQQYDELEKVAQGDVVYYSYDGSVLNSKEEYEAQKNANDGKGVLVDTKYYIGDVEVDTEKTYTLNYGNDDKLTSITYPSVDENGNPVLDENGKPVLTVVPAKVVKDGVEVDNPEYAAILKAAEDVEDVKFTYYIGGEEVAIDKDKTYALHVDKDGNKTVTCDGQAVSEAEEAAVLKAIDLDQVTPKFFVDGYVDEDGNPVEVDCAKQYTVHYDKDNKEVSITVGTGENATTINLDSEEGKAVIAAAQNGVAKIRYYVNGHEVDGAKHYVISYDGDNEFVKIMVGDTEITDEDEIAAVKAAIASQTASFTYYINGTKVDLDFNGVDKKYAIHVDKDNNVSLKVGDQTIDPESAEYSTVMAMINLDQVTPKYYVDGSEVQVDTAKTYTVHYDKNNNEVSITVGTGENATTIDPDSEEGKAVIAAAKTGQAKIRYYVNGHEVDSAKHYVISYDGDNEFVKIMVGDTEITDEDEIEAVKAAIASQTATFSYYVNGEKIEGLNLNGIDKKYAIHVAQDGTTTITYNGTPVTGNEYDLIKAAAKLEDVAWTYYVDGAVGEDGKPVKVDGSKNYSIKYDSRTDSYTITVGEGENAETIGADTEEGKAVIAAAKFGQINYKYWIDVTNENGEVESVEVPAAHYSIHVENSTVTVTADGGVELTKAQEEAVKKAAAIGDLTYTYYINGQKSTLITADSTFKVVVEEGKETKIYQNGTDITGTELAAVVFNATKNKLNPLKYYVEGTEINFDTDQHYTIEDKNGTIIVKRGNKTLDSDKDKAEISAVLAAAKFDQIKPTYKIGTTVVTLDQNKKYEIVEKIADTSKPNEKTYVIKAKSLDGKDLGEIGPDTAEGKAVIASFKAVGNPSYKYYVEYIDKNDGNKVKQIDISQYVSSKATYEVTLDDKGDYVVTDKATNKKVTDAALKNAIISAADTGAIKTTWYVGTGDNRLSFTSKPTVKIYAKGNKTDVYVNNVKLDPNKAADKAIIDQLATCPDIPGTSRYIVVGKNGDEHEFNQQTRIPVEKRTIPGEAEPRYYCVDKNGVEFEIDYTTVETIASTYDKWYNATTKQNMSQDQIKKFNTFIDSLAIASDFVVYSNQLISGNHIDGNVCVGYLKTKEGIKTEKVADGANNYSIILDADGELDLGYTSKKGSLIVSAADIDEKNKNNSNKDYYVELGTTHWWYGKQNATAQQVADKIKQVKGLTGALAQRVDEEIKISENLDKMAKAAQAFMDSVFDKDDQKIADGEVKTNAKKTLTSVLQKLKNHEYNESSVISVNLSEYDIANAQDTNQDTPGLIRQIISENKNSNATIIFNIVNYNLSNSSYVYDGWDRWFYDDSHWFDNTKTIDIGRGLGGSDDYSEASSNIIWNFGDFSGIVNIRQKIDGIVVAPKAMVNTHVSLNSSVYANKVNKKDELHKASISRKDLYFTDAVLNKEKEYNPYSETTKTEVSSKQSSEQNYTNESTSYRKDCYSTVGKAETEFDTTKDADTEVNAYGTKEGQAGTYANKDLELETTHDSTKEADTYEEYDRTAGTYIMKDAELETTHDSNKVVDTYEEYDRTAGTYIMKDAELETTHDSTKEADTYEEYDRTAGTYETKDAEIDSTHESEKSVDTTSENFYKLPKIVEIAKKYLNRVYEETVNKVTKTTKTSVRKNIYHAEYTVKQKTPPVEPPVTPPDTPPTETPETPTELPPVDPPTTPPELPPVNPPIITIEEPEVPLAGEVLGAKRPRGQVLGAKRGRGDVLGARRTPGTADANNLLQWMSLFGASSGALGAWALRNKKRREDEDKQ